VQDFKPLPGSRSTFLHPMPVAERSGFNRERFLALIEPHWRLNRSAVNRDTDQLVRYLARELDARVLEAASGSDALTWVIPSHWAVRRGQLRRVDGTVIADYAEHPLHLWTHSIGFQGRISRDELFAHHLQTDPSRPDEFIYHFRNGYRFGAREWGFSLPFRLVEQLTDDFYDVDIDADLDHNGTLKVVDAFLPGELPDTILIMAHTCHPALISDGIGCIGIAAELYHQLRQQPRRRYSYRFVFGPEYFGACAFLAHAGTEVLQNLRFGLYLDMLTNHEPIAFQRSMQGNSRLDRIVRNVLASHSSQLIERPYRRLWGNDELFYNGPGFAIPTVGLGRLMHREYHYHTDDLEHLSLYHARESTWILSRIVEVLESDYLPLRRYQGPIYLSRYGIAPEFDPAPSDPEALNRLQCLMDGQHSCADLADRFGLDFFQLRRFCDHLAGLGLLEKAPRPPRPEDAGTLGAG